MCLNVIINTISIKLHSVISLTYPTYHLQQTVGADQDQPSQFVAEQSSEPEKCLICRTVPGLCSLEALPSPIYCIRCLFMDLNKRWKNWLSLISQIRDGQKVDWDLLVDQPDILDGNMIDFRKVPHSEVAWSPHCPDLPGQNVALKSGADLVSLRICIFKVCWNPFPGV